MDTKHFEPSVCFVDASVVSAYLVVDFDKYEVSKALLGRAATISAGNEKPHNHPRRRRLALSAKSMGCGKQG